MSKDYQKYYTKKALNMFLESTFEIAFGDDAINKEYTMKEVVEKLREYSDNALKWEEAEPEIREACIDNPQAWEHLL